MAAICRANDARLCENETFYDGRDDTCWALIELDQNKKKTDVGKLMRELGALEWKPLVSAVEKAAGKKP